MTSTFRKNIALKVANAFKLGKLDFCPDTTKLLSSIPKELRVKVKRDQPQFLLPNNIFQPLNDLSKYELISNLKETGVTFDGISTIKEDPNQEGLIFCVNEDKFVHDSLKLMLSTIDDLPRNSILLQYIPHQKILVEFGSPNIAKVFHIGHLRSAILGQFISTLHEFLGHQVVRLNYLGDWGTQYGLLTEGHEVFGSEEELACNPIEYLQKTYAAANAMAETDTDFFTRAKSRFSQMEAGDSKLLQQWNYLREQSIMEYQQIYERLGINFTEIHGESMYAHEVPNVLKLLEEKNLLKRTENGAIVFSHQDTEAHLLKKDGSTVYLSRDIAAALDRKAKFNFDHMYYVVDHGQHLHFQHLFTILEAMGMDWAKQLHHIKYGRLLGISSRKGTAISLSDILDQGRDIALKIIINSPNNKLKSDEEIWRTAETLAVTGLAIADLKLHRGKDYQFSWEKALEFKGDSGLYLQYTHARLQSLEEKFPHLIDPSCDTRTLTEPEALELAIQIAGFEDAIYQSYLQLEPCILVQYLFRLCRKVGAAHKALKLKDENFCLAKPRMLLFHTSKQVLNLGLRILGLTPLNEV